VILKVDEVKLGSRGDVVKVADGYGRNYLLPRKLAIEASAANKAVIEQMKAAAVRRSAKEKTQAEELAKQFDGLSVSFQRRSGEHDQLFGSVTSGDIAEALARKSFDLDRRKIQLPVSPFTRLWQCNREEWPTAAATWLCRGTRREYAGRCVGSIYYGWREFPSGCRTPSGGTQQQVPEPLMAGPNGWARRPNRRQLTHPRGAAGQSRCL